MRRLMMVLGLVCALGLIGSTAAQTSVAGTDLYSISLETGEATLVDKIGDGNAIIGFALLAPNVSGVGPAVALTTDNELLEIDVNDPTEVLSMGTVGGLDAGESLIGIDFRPATGELFAISDQSVVYVIDLGTVNASAPGETLDPALEADMVGFDFNPAVDRIRVVAETGQNLRLNPDTGGVGVNPDTDEPTIDGTLAFAEGDENEGTDPNVVAAGYTVNVDGAQQTELYVIDSELDILATQSPPNEGVLNTVGPLGVDAASWTAFDIAPSGEAYAAIASDVSMPATGTGATMPEERGMLLGVAAMSAIVLGIAGTTLRVRSVGKNG